jgi:hypothetical protein
LLIENALITLYFKNGNVTEAKDNTGEKVVFLVFLSKGCRNNNIIFGVNERGCSGGKIPQVSYYLLLLP